MRDWLSSDHTALKKNYDYLLKQYLSPKLPAIAYGRYYAAKLFYADVYEASTGQTLLEVYKMHVAIKAAKSDYNLYDCFEYPLSFALLLTGHYEEALFYINYAFANYPHKEGHISQGCFEQLLLLKAVALLKINEKKEAEVVFMQLHPSQFYFTSKKFHTMLYLYLAYYLRKITQKQFEQFNVLLKETGFYKLTTLLDKVSIT